MHRFLWLFAMTLVAGDKDFNGRWNIKVENEPRQRVWWLEVEGAGTKSLTGLFVGAPGGDMNKIEQMTLDGGELRFSFERKYGYGSKADRERMRKGVWTARVKDGKLMGTFSLDGNVVHQWTGTRAPVIRDRDDGSWKEGAPVALMNGKDLSPFTAMVPGKELGWTVKDGMMTNVAGANNLVSKEKFWNFVLKAEYRLGPKSNSGIGLRGRYEVQILEDFGRTPDTHSHGALYSRYAPAVNASKPAGEWNTLEVRLVGRWVTVTLNGQKVVDGKEIHGLTAIAGNCDEADPGPIILQGDHGAVEFKSLTVVPLVRR